jgi:hypothetical protein
MERLLVIKLVGQGCTAEAWFNGLPLARVTPLATEAVVPAHEAALMGLNRLELVVGPDAGASSAAALLQTAPHAMAAQLHLLLPRIGAACRRDLRRARWLASNGRAPPASRSRCPRGRRTRPICRSVFSAGAGSTRRSFSRPPR